MLVSKIRKNIMGTISFTAKFKGMRKEQEFIVYANPQENLVIQADNKFGYVSLTSGRVVFGNCNCGAAFILSKHNVDNIENMEELKDAIRKTAGEKVGSSGIVYCDNSKAGNI